MSSDPRDEDDDIEVLPPDGPDRTDGSTELDNRDTWWVLFNDTAVRNYTIAAFSALAMIFLVLFQRGSDIGGGLIVLLGSAGILLRWVAAPPLVLLILTYFMVFPFGIPGEAYEDRWEIESGVFRVTDIILAMAVLVYVACSYRLIGFVYQAMAYEGAVKRRDESPTRRPPALITPTELGIFFAVAGGVVVVAQLVWWFANAIELTPTADFPIRWVGVSRARRAAEVSGGLSPGMTRFAVIVGLLFFGTLIARLVFGYWRLRLMGAAEGGMILLEGGWLETKRERSRLEKWRIWGRKRAEAKAKADEEQAKAEEARAKKAAEARTRTGGKR